MEQRYALSILQRILRISFLCVTVFSTAVCQIPSKINAHLLKMDKSAAFRQASWGFCLYAPATKQTLAQFQAEKSLVPASVLKTFTTATAIALLGDTFRFKTEMGVDGEISKQGVLKGNLLLKGFGNPVLGSTKGSSENGSSIVQLFANKVKEAGIRRIQGRLQVDVSYFEYEPVPAFWTWYDIGNYYAPHIGALNLLENQYELWFKPGKKVGDTTTFVKTIPSIPGLCLYNHTRTAAGGGDQTYIPGPPRSMDKHIYGTMPLGDSFKVKGAIPQPELFFLRQLHLQLREMGIAIEDTVSGTAIVIAPPSTKRIFTHYSAPLSQICQYANYTSNNLVAECILRTLGAEKGKGGSTQAGVDVVTSFVKSRLQNPSGFKIVDGSGLSKYNLVTASQLASFLGTISKEAWFRPFLASLPYSGKNGTLEKFCDNTKACNKVIAKSGSMERVKCYAGYIKDAKNGLNAFAIIVNNQDVPNRTIVEAIEGLMEVCVE